MFLPEIADAMWSVRAGAMRADMVAMLRMSMISPQSPSPAVARGYSTLFQIAAAPSIGAERGLKRAK